MASKQPLLNEQIYAPYKIAALVETLGEQGITAEACLAGTGLTLNDVYDPDTRTSVRQYILVCQNAVTLCSDPATPFRVGKRMHLSAYGMYGYALICSPTVRDFFDLGVKYHRLATPTATIEWREDKDSAVWVFPETRGLTTSDKVRQFLLEQQLTQHVTHIQDVVSATCFPHKICVAHPPPAHAALYEEYLHCSVQFSASVSEIYYDRTILEQKPQLAHRITSTLLQGTCDRLIGQVKTSSGVAGEVYQLLMQGPGQFVNMEEVASKLNMTSRTLRRKLDADETTFAKISDDVRYSLASEYLRTTSMSIEDIATALGFSDAANFRHAFKRWSGKTPSAFRIQE